MQMQSTATDQATYFDPANWQTNYSRRNVLLIASQFPHPSAVASYRQWSDLGRQVRKAEKAIRILAPVIRATDEGERISFREVPVFAYEQTDPILSETCPSCQAPMSLDDRFCGECGLSAEIQPETSSKDAYTIATADNVVIAEVQHVEIAPSAGILNPYTGETSLIAADLVKSIKPVVAAMRKECPAKVRKSCPDMAAVRIRTNVNTLTVSTYADGLPIEPVTTLLGSTSGTEIDAVLSFDNADMLTHILDTKKDAVLSIETAPDSNPYTNAKDGPDRTYLVIKQQSAAVGRFDTCRIITQRPA